ncbi:MAG: hypothetical protein PHI37_00030 [Candidatus Gracilibacteria bacterium]|nr:hypothetical protein [Candidatus Gracilibacteria bacterium]
MKKILLFLLLFFISLNFSFAEEVNLKINSDGTYTVVSGGSYYGYENGQKITSDEGGDVIGCSTGGDCSMFSGGSTSTTSSTTDLDNSIPSGTFGLGEDSVINNSINSTTSTSEKYTGNDYISGAKSETTDHNSSSYYNNNLKENTFTKDNLSNLQAAGYVDKDGNLTEAGKLASGQTDGKCGAKCAENLNTKAADSGTKGGGPDDLTSTNFIINVNDISPGIVSKGNNTEERVNWLLGTLIQKMMIALGTLSILMMTVGGGYIVFHNGQDEILSKGKSIFMSGIYAMVVALSSYLLVSIVRYILYT